MLVTWVSTIVSVILPDCGPEERLTRLQSEPPCVGCRSSFPPSEAIPRKSPCTPPLTMWDSVWGLTLRRTSWGESAGSASVFLQLFANNGNAEGLFRAGIMSSGSSNPTGDITDLQHTYDFVVQQVGCGNATDSLACLRTASTESLRAAASKAGPQAVRGYKVCTLEAASWRCQNLKPMIGPSKFAMGASCRWCVRRAASTRARGARKSSRRAFHHRYVPSQRPSSRLTQTFPAGDTQDEGTLFSLANLNITWVTSELTPTSPSLTWTRSTEPELASYLQAFWFPGASSSDIEALLKLYPADPAAGSPFKTGNANAFTPEYKRIAAIQGDFFQAARRNVLDRLSSTHTAYNFRAYFASSGLRGLEVTDLSLTLFSERTPLSFRPRLCQCTVRAL